MYARACCTLRAAVSPIHQRYLLLERFRFRVTCLLVRTLNALSAARPAIHPRVHNSAAHDVGWAAAF